MAKKKAEETETIPDSPKVAIDPAEYPAETPAVAEPQPEEKIIVGELPDQAEAMIKIQFAEIEAAAAERAMEYAAEIHKERKKAFEVRIDELRAVIRWANTPIVPESPNLFSAVPSVNGAGESSGGEASDELWRSFPLERWTAHDLPKGVIKKLSEASPPITTVGELSDYQAPKANGWVPKLTDIAGIGSGAAEKIGAASELFWAWWKREGEAIFRAEQEPSPAIDWSDPAPSQRAEA